MVTLQLSTLFIYFLSVCDYHLPPSKFLRRKYITTGEKNDLFKKKDLTTNQTARTNNKCSKEVED